MEYVSTEDELKQIVSTVKAVGAFAFDTETRAVLDRHPDVVDVHNRMLEDHVKTLKNKSPEIIARAHENFMGKASKMIALDPLRNEVFWISIATHGRSWAIPMGHKLGIMLEPEEVGDGTTVPPPGYRKILKNGSESLAKARYVKPAVYAEPPKQLHRSLVLDTLRPLFFDPEIVKVGHNVKFDARTLSKYYGEMPSDPLADTMVMQHIVNENLSSFALTQLIATNYNHHDPYFRHGKIGATIDSEPFDVALEYVHLDARWTWMLYQRLKKQIDSQEGLDIAFKQDSLVLRCLMEMENEGIPVDVRQLKNLGKSLDEKMREILVNLSDFAPVGFNPDSTKHKQEFLFNKKREGGLGLKPTKLTPKGAPSVDEESLRAQAGKHEAIELLLEWSETQKLKSTYVEGLIPKLNKGRLHPSFHLHRTATGRLSSSAPNLQNIPRTSDVRKLFIPPPGYTMLVADYDQIELRVMAMFSQDPEMCNIFIKDLDIHAGAAALMFNKPIEEVTDEERQIGKGANFLTAYGGGAGKLARTTGITMESAVNMINSYYKNFAGLTDWKRKVVVKGRARGYVTTLSGRRRRLPDLTSNDEEKRSRAERQAVNAIVQGSAADICKQAMIDINNALAGTDTKMAVQVHDELVAFVPEDSVDEIMPRFIEAMGDGTVLKGIPLKVSCHSSYNWAEAKGK